jgi:2-oxoisovalerate dehydrogenase E1 component
MARSTAAVPTHTIAADGVRGPERQLALYRALVFPRLVEEKMLILLRQGRLSKWFSGIGQEAIAVGVTASLRPDDAILPMHRNLGVFTARGLDLLTLFRQLLGRDGGFTRGRDRTFHFGAPDHHIVGMISHLGAMLPVADGLALAYQLRGESRVAATFTGEGATSEGDFHEAVNLAAVWKLPVLFIVENNQYALSTPVSEQYACRQLSDRGVGYGIAAETIDGNDLLAVVDAVERAAARARAGEGPTLLEFLTFRMRGHEEASGVAYVPPQLLEEWGAKDPVLRFEQTLLAGGVLTESLRTETRAAFKELIDRVADEAFASPEPDSTAEAELADVYARSRGLSPLMRAGDSPQLPEAERAKGAGGGEKAKGADGGEKAKGAGEGEKAKGAEEELRYIDAISHGLREAMKRWPEVILIGQDIAEYGGAFKVTDGMLDQFGAARVRNTPIIESGALGAAMGLAIEGFRPMVEMQFGDFISCGFNQIVNNLAKTHYRWGQGLPVVIRVPVGGGTGAGPYHSQNPEAWFTHVAGLKVVAPATPHDAKGLLLAAFQDGNPVLYLEHKFLYRSTKGPVPDSYFTEPIGPARLAREGSDVTIVTWGVGVHWALDAAETLAGRASVEVVDLRTLLPWDHETVLASVRKTSRALVLHEAPLTGGFGGEVAARIGEDAFSWLDAPVMRVAGLDSPVPFSKALEEIYSPKGRLLAALETLTAY